MQSRLSSFKSEILLAPAFLMTALEFPEPALDRADRVGSHGAWTVGGSLESAQGAPEGEGRVVGEGWIGGNRHLQAWAWHCLSSIGKTRKGQTREEEERELFSLMLVNVWSVFSKFFHFTCPVLSEELTFFRQHHFITGFYYPRIHKHPKSP